MIIESMDLKKQAKQVVSKKRVCDHGEVYTGKREVNAMLDLAKHETERIESRFLEPACGTGNFLIEILKRKLRVVETRYRKNQLEYEKYSVLVISSIYGIDILEDNIIECRNRLFNIFNKKYSSLYKDKLKVECRDSIKYILDKNIIWGDALTLDTVDKNPSPIIFSEWSSVNGSMIKRRDFAFHALLSHGSLREQPLFSDLGEDFFIPDSVKEYSLVHFLRIADGEQ